MRTLGPMVRFRLIAVPLTLKKKRGDSGQTTDVPLCGCFLQLRESVRRSSHSSLSDKGLLSSE